MLNVAMVELRFAHIQQRIEFTALVVECYPTSMSGSNYAMERN